MLYACFGLDAVRMVIGIDLPVLCVVLDYVLAQSLVAVFRHGSFLSSYTLLLFYLFILYNCVYTITL